MKNRTKLAGAVLLAFLVFVVFQVVSMTGEPMPPEYVAEHKLQKTCKIIIRTGSWAEITNKIRDREPLTETEKKVQQNLHDACRKLQGLW